MWLAEIGSLEELNNVDALVSLKEQILGISVSPTEFDDWLRTQRRAGEIQHRGAQ